MTLMRALVVDDEPPALSELTYLLEQDGRFGSVQPVSSGTDALRALEDDGVGADPSAIRKILDGQSRSDSVGLGNVDARLRRVYGDDHGLVVETAPGLGTKVSFRVPKYAPGVHPSA